ncbi:lipopolysaccharide biosynthesis protein [Bacteroides congonensis]|uniref:lipopolysaccharide biosynthesis protein n=1 Tax=Bacteroides congonensis TaxID=1871006 RepID=UPI000932270F|nr:lipopolysaccharide biosynthesis protein [Bacteroides congonensis]
MVESVKKQTLSGVKWTALEQFSTQAITFVLGVILARILSPSDYGTIGVLAVFMAVSQTFIDSGFGQALIRKPDLKDIDCNTVFYFNIGISILCYIILFICSPFIAEFFNMPILNRIVKIYCVILVIGALESVQISRLTINLNFKALAKVNVASTFVSGIIGLSLAYLGYGVWALVWQSVLSRIFHVIMIWSVARWHPQFAFSKNSFDNLFGFGSKLLAGGLLWQMYSNLIPIIIGKFFTAKDLGFYNRGTSLAQLPSGTIMGVLEKVTFPILAKLQNDTGHLIFIYRKYIKSSSMAIMFCLLLLAALAKPIVLILLTEKWVDCVVYLQIFIFAEMFDHVQKLNLNLLKVTGRSDYVLKLEIYKRTISVAIIVISAYWGVIGICASRVIIAQISLAFNTYYTGKLFGMGYFAQVRDFMPYALLSIIACAPSYILTFLPISNWIMLILGGMSAPFIYILILHVKHDEAYMEFVKPVISKYKLRKQRI